jgi:hypothetical protein
MAPAVPKLPLGTPPEWITASKGGWRSRVAVRSAAGALRAKERYDFQRACLPYLRVLLDQDAVEVPQMGGWDAAGIDHLSWPESGSRLRAVVQCKGFVASEHEVGASQATQCVQSIERFRRSGFRTDGYVLLHNRDERNPEFRKPIADALIRLFNNGSASWVALWDHHSLLAAVCDGLASNIEKAWRYHGLEAVRRAEALLSQDVIDSVPVRVGSHRIINNDIQGFLQDSSEVRDPTDILASSVSEGLRLVFGGFGVGKTTAALRLARRMGRKALYIPAALVNIQPSCRCGRYVVDRADLRSWLLWRAWLSRTPV